MNSNGPSSQDTKPTGPTLYLDENVTGGHFCPFVFEGAGETEYRIVQLTTGQSFESLQQALDTQLEDLQDPSEAAAVMLHPQTTDTEVLSAAVGEDTTMYGFRVNPEDLTGVSIAFSKLLQRWETQTGSVEVCLRGIESLFPYHDTNLLYRFLNTILATLQGAGADVHMHLNSTIADEQAAGLFKTLFTHIESVDMTEQGGEPAVSSADGKPTPSSAGRAKEEMDIASTDPRQTVTMSAAEIDAALEETGHGILAFAGESPYAIPMSFGYDSDRQELYLQLGEFEGSEKQARLHGSSNVSLVVSKYERPDRWRSIIVEGNLTPLSEEDRDMSTVHSVFANSKLASVDVFSSDPDEVTFSWYCLTPTSMSGRKSVNFPFEE